MCAILYGMSTSSVEAVPAVTLGWRLRMAMEYAGVKRDEMAAHLGVSPASITRWTHDDGAGPRKSDLRVWADLCGVSLTWLETGRLPGPKRPEGESGGLSRLTEAKRSRSRRPARGLDVTQPYGLDRAA